MQTTKVYLFQSLYGWKILLQISAISPKLTASDISQTDSDVEDHYSYRSTFTDTGYFCNIRDNLDKNR